MFIVLLFLPFLTFLVIGGLGRYTGRVGSAFLGSLGVGVTAIGFWDLAIHQVGIVWAAWGFLFDSVSVEMGLLITTITFCIIIYSLEYMWHDPYLIRFLSYLTLFAFFMLVLVTAGSLVQMFVGWEEIMRAKVFCRNVFVVTKEKVMVNSIITCVVSCYYFFRLGIICCLGVVMGDTSTFITFNLMV